MHSINNLFDMIDHRIIIYGAGYSGRSIHMLLTRMERGINIVAFCDTYKTGIEPKTGLQIIKPENLNEYGDAIIIIGIYDHLKLKEVQEVEQTLIQQNIMQEHIVRYTQLIKLFSKFSKDDFEWQSVTDDVYEYDTNMSLIKELATCIDIKDKSIVDLGAGAMHLQKFIPSDSLYYPVDFKRRCDQTVVCDFNKKEFSNINADVYVLCAMLYYINEPIWLLQQSAIFASHKIIIALHNKNLHDYPEEMHIRGFKNYFYFDEITPVLKEYGFIPVKNVILENIARRYVMYKRI